MGCRACGHAWLRAYPRPAALLRPLELVLWPTSLVALFVAPSPWAWIPLIAALALAGFARLGGVAYWGGLRCPRCGSTEMLR